MTNMANIRQSSEQKFKCDGKEIPFETGDFDRNGEFGENSEFGKHSPRWKRRMIIAVSFPIWAIGKKKPEKIRASTGFLLSNCFFRLLLSNCLNWNIYCDDHSSLSSRTAVQKWIISYIVHIRQDVSKNSNEMTKWPFESGDFDENGEIGVNDEYGQHSPKS